MILVRLIHKAAILHDGEGALAVARELYALSLSFLVSSRHQKALRLGLGRAENPVVTSQPLP